MSRSEDVRVEDLEELHYALGPANDFSNSDNIYEPFVRFCKSASKHRINLDYPIGGYHYDMHSFLDEPNKPNKFFSMDPTGPCTRKAGQYLVGYSRGYYGEFTDIPQKMATYAEEHNIYLHGPVYTVYLLDEICIKDPNQYLARISVSISNI